MNPDGISLDRAAERLRATAPMLQRARGEVETVLQGTSMIPALPSGAMVRIACSETPAFEAGAIVAVRAGGVLVIHRVLHAGRRARARRYLITRGDARWLVDPPVEVSAVLGVVTAVHGEDEWQAPRRFPTPLIRRWVSAVPFAVLCAALELHAPFAVWLGTVSNRLWLAHQRLLSLLRRLVRRGPQQP